MYYDMSGFDYGILDVVQVLHLRKRRGNYYDCPFCGETHGKLNINVEKNVFRCNRCDASGGMLKLYADLHNVTLSEANQLPVYDRERTICDCFKYRSRLDNEIFNKAINAYVKDDKKNLNNLSAYSPKLRVYKKVTELMEVLLNG